MQVTFHGEPMRLLGSKLEVGDQAKDVRLTATDLSMVLPLQASQAQPRLFLTVPSVDTSVCSLQGKTFSERLQTLGHPAAVFLISADLPFAQQRWSQLEGVNNITLLSDYRDRDFARNWGLLVQELSLLARSVFVLNREGIVTYREIVSELTQEPDYEAALAALQALL